MNHLSGFDLLILTLASCYWAFVLVKKEGPYRLFTRLRERTTLGGLLLCPPCLVLWVGGLLLLALLTDYRPLTLFVQASAVAGGACLLGYYTGMWQQ